MIAAILAFAAGAAVAAIIMHARGAVREHAAYYRGRAAVVREQTEAAEQAAAWRERAGRPL